MKPKLLALSVLLVASLPLTSQSVLAQSSFVWGNAFGTTTTGIRAPIYGVDPNDPSTQRSGNTATGLPAGTQTYGGPLLEGTGYTAALFAGLPGTPEALLQRVDATVFRTGSFAGYLVAPRTASIPSAPEDSFAPVQIRVWDNLGGTVTSWSQVMAMGTVPAGVSALFTVGPLHDPNVFHRIGLQGVHPTPQATGVRSFNLVIVPEPSLIALLVAAGCAALLRRRVR